VSSTLGTVRGHTTTGGKYVVNLDIAAAAPIVSPEHYCGARVICASDQLRPAGREHHHVYENGRMRLHFADGVSVGDAVESLLALALTITQTGKVHCSCPDCFVAPEF
jgi:hypothetical protein